MAQGSDFSGTSGNGCLVQHSQAWCLMAVKGFGNQLSDIPPPPAEPQPSSDLATGRAVSQGVTAGGVALHARAAAGFDPMITRGMGVGFIVLDLLTYQDPTLPLRGFRMLVWMPKDQVPAGETPKQALQRMLLQAMVTATASGSVEPVDVERKAIFKTDVEHFYKLVGEGKHEGKLFISKLWRYNNGLSWSEDRAPEYLGGHEAYTFDMDIVPTFTTLEKSRDGNVNHTVLKAMSAALPAWAIIYVPPLSNNNPYLLQQGNVLAFERPAAAAKPQ
jgi:hypothetical protein